MSEHKTILALSLWQPWASLMASGHKSIETRSWYTHHRGLVAICAAKRWTLDQAEYLGDPRFRKALANPLIGGPGVENPATPIRITQGELKPLANRRIPRRADGSHLLPLGCVVAVARLVHVFSTDHRYTVNALHRDERAFGNYQPGRFGWAFEEILPLAKPLPWRGEQGLFEIPAAPVAERLVNPPIELVPDAEPELFPVY
ncbi:MAG: hypothetical protein AAFQ53_18260 [Bacteroidota bacterium]